MVRRGYLHYISKYRRFEKRYKNIAVHCSSAFHVKEGCVITIGQCIPLSKTVRFNVVAHEPAVNTKAGKKTFRVFYKTQSRNKLLIGLEPKATRHKVNTY